MKSIPNTRLCNRSGAWPALGVTHARRGMCRSEAGQKILFVALVLSFLTGASSLCSADGAAAGTASFRASTLVGAEVRNPQGERLGSVTDLLIDSTDGRVVFIAVAPGGIAGLTDRVYAVPFSAVTYDERKKSFILGISRDRLVNAPSLDRRSWTGLTDRSWSESVYRYYGLQPYWAEGNGRTRQMRDLSAAQGARPFGESVMRNVPGGGIPPNPLMEDRLQRERQR